MNSILKTLEHFLPYRLYKPLKRFEHEVSTYPFRPYTKQYQCVFIHVPKVAGTSILNCLMGDEIFRDHATHFEYKVADPGKFNQYYKFSFVRNPWDRVVAIFEYLNNGGNQNEDMYFHDLIKTKYPTFEAFVLDYLNKDIIHEHVLFKPQYLFLYDFKLTCKVDFVGRFESIENDFKTVSQKIGLNMALPKLNCVKHRNYQAYYTTSEMIERVGTLYQKDVELFNYTFPEPCRD